MRWLLVVQPEFDLLIKFVRRGLSSLVDLLKDKVAAQKPLLLKFALTSACRPTALAVVPIFSWGYL